jgi:hypothetical protein
VPRRGAKGLVLGLALLCWSLPLSSWAQEPDWGDYGALLDRHLSQKTEQGISLAWLDYPALAQDSHFAEVVKTLTEFPLERLVSKEEKLAFYINAYNIFAIKMVLDHWPVESIKAVGSWFNPVWKKPIGKLGGKTVTLHEVEHEILRKMGEPRIHMAIVCASLSCPDLRAEPYEARVLEEQLEQQSQHFFNNGEKGVKVTKEGVEVSKILDWFSEDFGDPIRFLRRYRPDLPASLGRVGYLSYNWSLNGGSE